MLTSGEMVKEMVVIRNLWSVFGLVEKVIRRVDVTSSKGGFCPMGKLIVFKLITSWTDDIFVNGPYTDLRREGSVDNMEISQHRGNGPKDETFGSPIFIQKDFDILYPHYHDGYHNSI